MRCRAAIPVGKGPAAKAVIALAFSMRKNGKVNLPTHSIVEKTVQLYQKGLAQKMIFWGGASAKNITEAESMSIDGKAIALKIGNNLSRFSQDILLIQEPEKKVKVFNVFRWLAEKKRVMEKKTTKPNQK